MKTMSSLCCHKQSSLMRGDCRQRLMWYTLPHGRNCWLLMTLQQWSMPKSDVGRKSQFLPQLGGPCRNIAIPFGIEKLEWCGYPTVKKSDDMLSRFNKYRHGHVTDRWTDGRKHGRTSCDSIVRTMHSITW